MGLLSITRRAGKDAAGAVTGAAAVVTGAAYGAVTGAFSGATRGASQALGTGPRSTPAAALAVATVGAAGLVDWPVLVLASGTVLVLRQLGRTPATPPPNTPHASLPSSETDAPSPVINRAADHTIPRKTAAPTKASAPRKTTGTSRQANAAGRARKATVTPAKSDQDDRHVVPNPEGGWDVRAPKAERASDHTDTQADAISRAREITRNTGGQTVTHKTDGTIRDHDSTSARNPVPPKS